MLLWVLAQCGYQYYFSWMLLGFHSIVEDLRTGYYLFSEANSGVMASVLQGLAATQGCSLWGPECVFEP
jgi:hypothetical protein